MNFREFSPNQRAGLIFGAVYVLLGAVGFAVTGFTAFAGTQGEDLIVFELNPLHNIVHLAVGGLLVTAVAAGADSSRVMNTAVGAVYFGVGLFGLFAIGTDTNIIALNEWDNALHFVSGLLLMGFGTMAFTRRGEGTAVEGGTFRQAGPSRPRRRGPDEDLEAGDEVPDSGTYRCSCNDFALFVRAGTAFPQCPVGEGHHYTLTTPASQTT